MKTYLKSKLIIVLLRLGQGLLFCIPFVVLMIIYRDKFFTAKTGIGMTGLGVLGLLVYLLCLMKVFGKMPKILYFVCIFLLFFLMNYLAEFLYQIGCAILIGACLALPLNLIIHAKLVQGETDLKERARISTKEAVKKERETNKTNDESVEVEID